MGLLARTVGAVLRCHLVRSVRAQFYGAIVLAGVAAYTGMHMPQGFYDYVFRCLALLLASICCIHVVLENHKLSRPERMLLVPFSIMLAFATMASLDAAFHVKMFSDR